MPAASKPEQLVLSWDNLPEQKFGIMRNVSERGQVFNSSLLWTWTLAVPEPSKCCKEPSMHASAPLTSLVVAQWDSMALKHATLPGIVGGRLTQLLGSLQQPPPKKNREVGNPELWGKHHLQSIHIYTILEICFYLLVVDIDSLVYHPCSQYNGNPQYNPWWGTRIKGAASPARMPCSVPLCPRWISSMICFLTGSAQSVPHFINSFQLLSYRIWHVPKRRQSGKQCKQPNWKGKQQWIRHHTTLPHAAHTCRRLLPISLPKVAAQPYVPHNHKRWMTRKRVGHSFLKITDGQSGSRRQRHPEINYSQSPKIILSLESELACNLAIRSRAWLYILIIYNCSYLTWTFWISARPPGTACNCATSPTYQTEHNRYSTAVPKLQKGWTQGRGGCHQWWKNLFQETCSDSACSKQEKRRWTMGAWGTMWTN